MIRINIVEEEERITEGVEVKIEETKGKDIMTITVIVTLEEIAGGTGTEKNARRCNLDRIVHPKNLLQAVKGARSIEKKDQ